MGEVVRIYTHVAVRMGTVRYDGYKYGYGQTNLPPGARGEELAELVKHLAKEGEGYAGRVLLIRKYHTRQSVSVRMTSRHVSTREAWGWVRSD